MTQYEPSWYVDPLIDWLLSEGRFAENLEALSKSLGHQLIEAGAPIWRLRLGIRTLHPLIAALSGTWERDGGLVEIPQATHGLENRSSYIGSPLEIIQKTGAPFRRNLRGDLASDDHIVLQELKERGATDYFGLPMTFTGNTGGLLVLVCDDPDGFSDHDIAMFTRLSQILAPALEVIRLKHISEAVTQTYLGPRSAARVLSGQITRGHVETIRAAILFSDIRGWTALNTRRPATETVAIANRYFDIVTEAVMGNTGEVLKLMGDGMLAIFPADNDTTACNNALLAASVAQETAALDPDFDTRFGIAMHIGDVLYGNIGSSGRLDFTVLGAAVNLTARLEGLCARLDRGILFSEDFARRLDTSSHCIATETIKGIDRPQPIYALA